MMTIIPALALVLSMVVLLTAADERSRRVERVSHDYKLDGLRHLETCKAASKAMADPNKVKSDPDDIVQRIVKLTKRCLEYLDAYKNEYVSIYAAVHKPCGISVLSNMLFHLKVQ